MEKKTNKNFLEEQIQIANNHMIQCFIILIIRVMKIKTTMQTRLTPQRQANIKNKKNQCQHRLGEKRTHSFSSGNVGWSSYFGKLCETFSKNQKLNFHSQQHLSWEYIFRIPRTQCRKTLYTPLIMTALFTVAKICKQPKCLRTDVWIKKKWYIYTRKYNADVMKNEKMKFAQLCMDMESIMLSEIMSYCERDRPNDHTH